MSYPALELPAGFGAAMLADAPRPRRPLHAGHYILENCIGLSSNAVIYRGCHQDLPGEKVAVKILQPALLEDRKVVQRFHREYASALEISHPNVIRAFEFVNSERVLAYSMELAENGDLAEILKKGAFSTIDQVLWLSLQICAGLEAIHLKGFVHRDIKAENIFITKCGSAKIADFGVIHCDTEKPLTRTGEVLGTLRHISPEYMTDGVVDARSDIYAVGLLMYEMVTGEFPFEGSGPLDTLTRRLSETPTSPARLRPECPAMLSKIIMKSLERDPERRYQSVGLMLRDLSAVNPNLANASLAMRGQTVSSFPEQLKRLQMRNNAVPVTGTGERFGRAGLAGSALYCGGVAGFLLLGFAAGNLMMNSF